MRFALYLVFVGFIHNTLAQGASSQSSFDFSMFSNGNNGATSNGLGSGLAATTNTNGLGNSGANSQNNALSTMLTANQNSMNMQGGSTQGGLAQNVNQNQMMNTNQNQMMNTNQNQMMNTNQNQMMNTNQNQMNMNQNQMNMNQNQMNSGMGINQNNLVNGQTMNNGMGMNQNSVMNSQNMNMNSMNNMGMNNPQRNTMQNGVVIQSGAMMPNQFGMQQGMPNGMGQVMTNMNFQDPTQMGRFNGNNLNNLGFDNTQGSLFQNQLNAQNTPFFGQQGQFGQSGLLQTQGVFGQDPFGSSVLGGQIVPQFASTFPGQPGFGPFVDPMMNAFAPNPFMTSPMMSNTMMSSPMMSSPIMGSVMAPGFETSNFIFDPMGNILGLTGITQAGLPQSGLQTPASSVNSFAFPLPGQMISGMNQGGFMTPQMSNMPLGGSQQQALPFNMPGMVPPFMTMPMMPLPPPPTRRGK